MTKITAEHLARSACVYIRASTDQLALDDGGQDGEVTVHIDGNELSLAEFGQLLKYYAGWGMRVTFVPRHRIIFQTYTQIQRLLTADLFRRTRAVRLAGAT